LYGALTDQLIIYSGPDIILEHVLFGTVSIGVLPDRNMLMYMPRIYISVWVTRVRVKLENVYVTCSRRTCICPVHGFQVLHTEDVPLRRTIQPYSFAMVGEQSGGSPVCC
jgi:hypothetical protein